MSNREQLINWQINYSFEVQRCAVQSASFVHKALTLNLLLLFPKSYGCQKEWWFNHLHVRIRQTVSNTILGHKTSACIYGFSEHVLFKPYSAWTFFLGSWDFEGTLRLKPVRPLQRDHRVCSRNSKFGQCSDPRASASSKASQTEAGKMFRSDPQISWTYLEPMNQGKTRFRTSNCIC